MINYQMFATKWPTKWIKACVPEQVEFKNISSYLMHKISDTKVQQDLLSKSDVPQKLYYELSNYHRI